MRALEQAKGCGDVAFGHNCKRLMDSCGDIAFGHYAPINTRQHPEPAAPCSSPDKRSKRQDFAQRPSVVPATRNTITMQQMLPG